MNYSVYLVLLVLCSIAECIAVSIKRLEVPSTVITGTESVVLDCEYSTPPSAPAHGLVIKWFFNGTSGLVYQWIPPRKPQAVGLLKGIVDTEFRISEDPLQAYRAIKILKPATHLSGSYTCVVSTFMEEDRRTKSMLVYSTGKGFYFYQEKKYVFVVTLKCMADELYPKPVIVILSQGKPLQQAVTETKMNAWGLYSVTTTALVHDQNVTSPFGEFVCMISLPGTNFVVNRTTTYYPGLMPTAYIAAVEMEKHQERRANDARRSKLYPLHVLCAMLLPAYRQIFKFL